MALWIAVTLIIGVAVMAILMLNGAALRDLDGEGE